MLSLEERVKLLEKIILHNDLMSRLALESGWDESTIDCVYKIMDKYSEKARLKTDDFNFAEIESDFEKIRINRIDLKSIFLTFYEEHKYLEVLKVYLETNFQAFGGNLSSEFNEMYRDLCSNQQIKLI